MISPGELIPPPGFESDSLALDDYAFLVSSTRKNDMGDDWASLHAGFILGEIEEAMYQHGPGLNLLLSNEYDYIIERRGVDVEELRDDVADEVADMLWFGFSAAEYLEQTPGSLVVKGLASHGVIGLSEPHNFNDLQKIVVDHADEVRFRSKYSLECGDESDTGLISLEDSPGYALNRVTGRLAHALLGDDDSPRLRTASDLEPQSAIDDALGEYICVIAYIATSRLNRDIETLAWHNIEKLIERERWGKPDKELAETFSPQKSTGYPHKLLT